MRILYCKECGCEILFNSKSSYKLYCESCKKKRNSKRVMLQRKLKHPEIEIGVGSGNNSKNKNRILTQNNYRKMKKDYCEICGDKNNLCVHHIDYNRNNNDINNLITVCKKCHQEYHIIRDELGRFKSHKLAK